MGAVSSVVESVADVVESTVGAVSDVAGSIDDVVNDTIPGGWATVASVAVPGAGPAIAAANTLAQGGDIEDAIKSAATSAAIGAVVNQSGLPSAIAQSTGSEAAAQFGGNVAGGLLSGQDLESAVQNAALNTGVSQAAGQITGQTPQDFENDINQVLDSIAGIPVNEFQTDINQVLDMPASQPVPEIPPEQIMVTETPPDLTPAPTLDEIVTQIEAGSLGSASDLPEPTLESTPEPVSGMDLAADATPGNTLADVADVLSTVPETTTEPGLTKAQVEALIKTALVASAATAAADQLTSKPEASKGFDIVPVPTDWKSPVYDQSFTPIDLNTIFGNLQGMQTQWKPRPNITGGAYMGSPVNISDIVNNIMSAELTPQAMPANITNAVGGILGSSTTR